ncbi:hypothetical protein CMEL01_09510 [Colletotrichum melonis]|uniref:Uncharacterized protein n=1 Tax=Colletotrichum melonis TaxID=1209925 RepID=A0AAI9TXH3_9PEZI|nr:hypothetical protein CMEL01_09510 [Colletotrichum melonis]
MEPGCLLWEHCVLTVAVSKQRIEELGRQERCSSASTSTSASISTRSPPLYYGTTPLMAGTDDRRMNPQQLPKVPCYPSSYFCPLLPLGIPPFFAARLLPFRLIQEGGELVMDTMFLSWLACLT